MSSSLITILIVVIAVGIMNTMWMSVRERTGEIGTLRAIGMQTRQRADDVHSRGDAAGLVATTVGALLACGFVELLEPPHIPIPWDAVRVILISDTLHLADRSVAGGLRCRGASRLSPGSPRSGPRSAQPPCSL